ncbi:hypothetical protein K3495_g1514 [Podosphaera aphanis]|nr:hypothetical protein K3495_g1514 [Podosphaera aphanis]
MLLVPATAARGIWGLGHAVQRNKNRQSAMGGPNHALVASSDSALVGRLPFGRAERRMAAGSAALIAPTPHVVQRDPSRPATPTRLPHRASRSRSPPSSAGDVRLEGGDDNCAASPPASGSIRAGSSRRADSSGAASIVMFRRGSSVEFSLRESFPFL